MKYHLLLWIVLWSLTSTRVADGQTRDQYEAVELLEMSRENCIEDECEVRGSVGTTTVNSQGSVLPTVAVYGVHLRGQNGTMYFLGESPVTHSSPHFDSWNVSFQLQDAPIAVQSLILLYIRASIRGARKVQLTASDQGKNTRMFLLDSSDQCQLCRSNASVLMGVEATIQGFSVANPTETVPLRCTSRDHEPCPIPTSSVSTSISTSSSSESPTPAATDSTSSGDTPRGSGVAMPTITVITTLVPVAVAAVFNGFI